MLEPDDERLIGAPRPGDGLEGKYTIERVLGAGGMGLVLAARHATLGQRVAIKMLLPEGDFGPGPKKFFLGMSIPQGLIRRHSEDQEEGCHENRIRAPNGRRRE